jgi:anti-sigma B factor antagonist
MRVTQRKEGDIQVIELSGRMTIGQGDAEAGDAIRAAVAAGEKKILLDMRDVPVLDSSGVGELISGYTSANNKGAVIKLLKLSPRVGEVLLSTRLIGILEAFEDEVVALESFA